MSCCRASHREASQPGILQNSLCFATHPVGLADDELHAAPVPLVIL